MKKVTSFFASSIRTVLMCTVVAWLSVFNTASAQCSQPSNLNANNLTPTSVELSWSAISGANNYRLQYRANGTATWTTVSAIQGTSYTLSSLNHSTVYRWRVKASCSSYSSIAFFNSGGGGNNTSCSQPSNLNAVSTSNTSVILSWSQSSGAFNYTVQYRVKGTGSFTTISLISGLSVPVTGLLPGVTYEFKVKSSCSVYSSIALFTTSSTGGGGGTTCSAPSNTNTVSVTATTANVTWEAVNTATSYIVQYRLENAVSYTTVGTFTTANATITGLMPGQQYVWRVKASCSPYGSDVQFTTTGTSGGGGGTTCSAPSNTNTVSVTATTANVTWEAVNTATSYLVEYRLENAVSYTTVGTFTTANATITGLMPGQQYVWRVKASCSPYGSDVQFTTTGTSGGGGGTTCSAPSNTNTVAVTATTANVAWEAVNTATSYLVEYRLENAVSYTTVGTFTTANASITGLMPGQQYVWRVKASCSPYGSDVQFTTPANRIGMQSQNEFKFSAFPNPVTNGSLEISSDKETGMVHILDVTGKTIVAKEFSSQSNKMDVSSLKNGIYFIYMVTDNQTSSVQKLIIGQ